MDSGHQCLAYLEIDVGRLGEGTSNPMVGSDHAQAHDMKWALVSVMALMGTDNLTTLSDGYGDQIYIGTYLLLIPRLPKATSCGPKGRDL